MSKVKFFIPGIGDKRISVASLSMRDKLEKYPHMFRDMEIGAIYGHYPNTAWAGGRFTYGSASADVIRNDLSIWNSYGIPVRYTFTNSLITEGLTNDVLGNIVLTLASSTDVENEVLVNNDILEQYIRSTYPRIKVCLSTTKRITTKEQYEQYRGKYEYIVLDYSFNRNPEIFELEDKEHIEVLVMTYCKDDCPNRMHHQYVANMSNQELYSPTQHYEFFTCPYFKDKDLIYYDHMKEHKHIITPDELWDTYVPAGFVNIKLEGRGNNIFDVLESYVDYMVLPEYRNEIRLMVEKDIVNNMVA